MRSMLQVFLGVTDFEGSWFDRPGEALDCAIVLGRAALEEG